MLNEIMEKVLAFFGNLPLLTMVIVIVSVFVALTLLVIILTVFISRIKRANKRPYLSLVNAFTALLFAALLLEYRIESALLISLGLWFVGFMCYGLLSLLTPERREKTFAPAPVVVNKTADLPQDMPSPTPNVRLEHAMAVSEKLLKKNLTKGDRMDIERIKGNLRLLECKANLTLEDGRTLNDGFNALIKYMARYNL